MADTGTPLTEAQMRDMAERSLHGWNNQDVDAILDGLADDIVWADPSLPETLHGKEAVAASLLDTFTAFPDLDFPVEDWAVFPDAERQTCVVTWSLRGTMTGPMENGVPPTNKPVRTSGAALVKLRDGEVVEYTNYYDALDFMQQLGLLPRTTSLPFKALVMTDVLAGKVTEQAMKVLHR